jgi:hypothetical protein
VKVNWSSGFDIFDRPIQTVSRRASRRQSRRGQLVLAVVRPRTGYFYVSAWENCATIFGGTPCSKEGRNFGGNASRPYVAVPGAPFTWTTARSDQQLDRSGSHRRGAGTRCDDRRAEVAVPDDRRHRQRHLTTASDLLFTGGRGVISGAGRADRRAVRKASLGAQIVNGPISREVGGKQYVATVRGCRCACSVCANDRSRLVAVIRS